MLIYFSMKNFFRLIIPFLWILILSCENNSLENENHRLVLIESFDLNIPEPSGISLGINEKSLWIVSDPSDNRIYQTDLRGHVLKILPFRGNDLEGIWYDRASNHIWIVEEQERKIVELDTFGTELNRHSISYNMAGKYGFEGISRDDKGNFWICNEKLPSQILYLSNTFKILNTFDPSVIDDLSGLSWVDGEDSLWLVSDESQLLVKWLPDQDVVAYYELPLDKPEGVAIDRKNSKIYIVSDLEEKLYIFKLP